MNLRLPTSITTHSSEATGRPGCKNVCAPARWLSVLILGLPVVLTLVFASVKQVVDLRHVGKGDEVGYFAWQQSWLSDGDLDPSDEIRESGTPLFPDEVTGPGGVVRVLNKYPTGLSLAWLPLTAPAHAAVVLGNDLLGLDVREDGQAGLVVRAAWAATTLWSVLGMLAAYATARRLVGDDLRAAMAVAAAWAGTAAFVYTWKLPLWSHGVGVGMLSLAAYFATRLVDDARVGRSIAWIGLPLGCFAAMTLTVRPTHALFLLPIAVATWVGLFPMLRTRARAIAGASAVTLLSALPVLMLELSTRKALYGDWFFNGYAAKGESFDWSLPHLDEVLFYFAYAPVDGGRGMLTAHPITAVAIAGLTMLVVRGKAQARTLAGLLLLGLVATVLMYGAWWFWNLGWSYGARWTADLLPVWAIGIAVFLDRTGLRPSRAAVLLVLLCLWSICSGLGVGV